MLATIDMLTELLLSCVPGLLVDLTGHFSYVFYASSFFMVTAALFMGFSFCTVEKNKLTKTHKPTLENPSRGKYTEVPTELRPGTNQSPAVIYVTSI